LLPVNVSERRTRCVEAKRVEGSRYAMRIKSRPVRARLHRSGFEGEGIAGRIWIESAGWGWGGVWEDELVGA
jgi:hypothetical protein